MKLSGHLRRRTEEEEAEKSGGIQYIKGLVRHMKEPGLYLMDQGRKASWGLDFGRSAFQKDPSSCSSFTRPTDRIPVNPGELQR